MKQTTRESRDTIRCRLVDVATQLLAAEGIEGVTTRSVAVAAGVQAPYIYRHFGDKSGLLDAVLEQGFARYLEHKAPLAGTDDPVADLRAAWALHIGFGLENPALFRLMHTARRTPKGEAMAQSGTAVLSEMISRVAQAGLLRLPQERAVMLVRSIGIGTVFTIIDRADRDLDPTIADDSWDAVCASILVDAASKAGGGPVPAAVTLRAALPDLTDFTLNERRLFGEWIDRVSNPGTDDT